MRLIKMFGLAATTAVAAMAFVGPTSASAADTQLCESHSALTCGAAASTVSMTNEGVGLLLSNLVTVLCLTISMSATPLALGNPQQVHITALSFENCGTKSAHNNCGFGFGDPPLANLNKTGLDSGTLTLTNGLFGVACENVDIFGVDIHCIYDFTGMQFAVGAQHLTASETTIDKVSGELCPSQSAFDLLLKTTANRYVLA